MVNKHFTEKKISIYSLIISIISIGVVCVFSFKQCNLENKLNKLHINPTLDYYLARSIDKNSLEFYLKNKSPIPVVNLSVTHKFFVFSDKANEYILEKPADFSILDSPGQNWIFKQKLHPNESVGKKEYQIISLVKFYKEKTKFIVAAIFEITFYRENNMEQFNNKAIFFLDGERIYSYKNALDQEHLKEPIKQLPAFELKTLNFRKDSNLQKSGSKLFQKAN